MDNVEELLLSRQPEELGKYTFAALFINKVFTDPNKKRRIRRILMITQVQRVFPDYHCVGSLIQGLPV